MLRSKASAIVTLTTGIAAILLYSTGSGEATEGPSFDCSHGVNSALAIILCNNSDAAKADWDLNSAFWARYSDDNQLAAFNQAVRRRCGLPLQPLELERMYGFPVPAVPAPEPITEAHVRCVIGAFKERTARLRANLRGDALSEAWLTPEQHIDIQQSLIGKGFLTNRVRKYSANADGQFGPNTRAAIRDYQRSIGANPTGFLSDQQRSRLLESPEEIEARQARIEAEAKAAQAEKLAEEQKKRDEERAKQEGADRERKRLEEEAAGAAEWRKNIEEAQKKGPEYAAKISDVKWTLHEHTNPMTEEIEYTASSIQSNNSGAAATVEGSCEKDRVLFQATLENASDPKGSLGFITSYDGGIIGRKRVNDGPVLPANFPAQKWRNRITVSSLSFRQQVDEAADTTWRVLAEIETSRGTLYIKVAIFNDNVQKLVTYCQHQYELEKEQGPRPNAPESHPM